MAQRAQIIISALILTSLTLASGGNNDVTADGELKNEIDQLRSEIKSLKAKGTDDLYATLEQTEANVKTLQAELQRQKLEIEKLKQFPKVQRTLDGKSRGVNYIRWGRTTCDGDAVTIYRGHAAGPHYNEAGSGSNMLCLHEQPQWNKYFPGYGGWAGMIYGVEYELLPESNVFSSNNHGGIWLKDVPAPCVACYVPHRASVLTVPARTECPHGWTREYRGYIVSEYHGPGRHRTEYTCFDEAPENAPGGTNQNQAVVYPVQVTCGSLPCSRFINGFELTCVVCTK